LKQAVITRVPSGLNDPAMTLCMCRSGELKGLPVTASQILAVPSKLVVIT
jgi:hypothetical protein